MYTFELIIRFKLNFIPICWNVLILLKYDLMHIFMHHLSLYIIFETTAQIPEVEYGGKYGHKGNNKITELRIWGQIRIFEGKYEYLMVNTDIFPEGK